MPQLVFLDTEFTRLDSRFPQLITLGLVHEDGLRAFYGELENFDLRHCSQFVRDVVLPRRTGENRMHSSALAPLLHEWLTGLGPDVFVASDFKTDFALLAALLGRNWPGNVNPKNFFVGGILVWDECQDAKAEYWRQQGEQWQHHALHDAHALRCAWLAVDETEKADFWRGRLETTNPP